MHDFYDFRAREPRTMLYERAHPILGYDIEDEEYRALEQRYWVYLIALAVMVIGLLIALAIIVL